MLRGNILGPKVLSGQGSNYLDILNIQNELVLNRPGNSDKYILEEDENGDFVIKSNDITIATFNSSGLTLPFDLNVLGDINGDISLNNGLLSLLSNNVLTDTKYGGFYLRYNEGSGVRYGGIIRDPSNNYYYLFKDTITEPTEDSVSFDDYGDLALGQLTVADDIDILGAGGLKLNGTTVLSGNTLSSAITSSSLTSVGNLTTLNVNGDMTILQNSVFEFGNSGATFFGSGADGYIRGAINSTKKIDINSNGLDVSGRLTTGTFNASSNNGFSGNIVSYSGELNGAVGATTKYSYGNSSTGSIGIVMPTAGKIIAIAVSSSVSSTGTATLYDNNSTSGIGVSLSSSTTNYTIITHTFTAGTTLQMVLTSGTLTNSIATFWVKYD